MLRNKYFLIRSKLKVLFDYSISQVERENRLWKVRPMIDSLRNRCLKNPRSSFVSIDEQLIPFTGTTQLKQCVLWKTNQVGLKIFVVASPSGNAIDFVIYQGKGCWNSGIFLQVFNNC